MRDMEHSFERTAASRLCLDAVAPVGVITRCDSGAPSSREADWDRRHRAAEEKRDAHTGVRRWRRDMATVSLAAAVVAGGLGASAQAAGHDRGGRWHRGSSTVVAGLETDASDAPLGIDEPRP